MKMVDLGLPRGAAGGVAGQPAKFVGISGSAPGCCMSRPRYLNTPAVYISWSSTPCWAVCLQNPPPWLVSYFLAGFLVLGLSLIRRVMRDWPCLGYARAIAIKHCLPNLTRPTSF